MALLWQLFFLEFTRKNKFHESMKKPLPQAERNILNIINLNSIRNKLALDKNNSNPRSIYKQLIIPTPPSIRRVGVPSRFTI